MVDIELLNALQSISYIAGATGVCIAAIYYVLNLRNTQKNMQLTLETRQAQFFMQLYERLESDESQRRSHELRRLGWIDFEDWYKKYDWRVNEEAYARFVAQWRRLDSYGFLVMNKLVDSVKMYEILGYSIIYNWERYKEIILGLRERLQNPIFQQHFEFLYNEMVKIRDQRGDPNEYA